MNARNNQNNNRIIDIYQFMNYIKDNILRIIIVGVLGALVLLGYGFLRAKNATSPLVVYKAIIDNNKTSANPKSGTYMYPTDREVIEGSCVIKSQLYIEYNLADIENSENVEYVSYISRLQNDTTDRMFSGSTLVSIVNDINSRDYNGLQKITADDLRYMLNWSFSSSNVGSFSVTDVDVKRATDIANLLNNHFLKNGPSLESINSVNVLEQPTVYYDTTELQHEAFELSSIVNYLIIGFFFGIFFAFCICFVVFFIKYTVRSDTDINNLGIDVFARIPSNKDNNNEFKRMAYNLSILANKERILIVPVDSKTDVEFMVTQVSDELKTINSDIKLVVVKDIISSPDATLEAAHVDGILLATTFGETLVKKVEYAVAEMKKTNKELLGVIIEECKH